MKIGNYSSPDFHIQFRSLDDLVSVLTAIFEYKKDSDNYSKKIVVVVDEAPIYFNSRDFKNFPKEIIPFLVQLRKLNVMLIAICQDLRMLDVNFRRLCSEVTEYTKPLRLFYFSSTYKLLTEDALNLRDPSVVEHKGTLPMPWPWLVVLFRNAFSFSPVLYLFFGSSRYDTHELIIPNYSILPSSPALLLEYFPSTTRIYDGVSYYAFVRKKLSAMVDALPSSVLSSFEYLKKIS